MEIKAVQANLTENVSKPKTKEAVPEEKRFSKYIKNEQSKNVDVNEEETEATASDTKANATTEATTKAVDEEGNTSPKIAEEKEPSEEKVQDNMFLQLLFPQISLNLQNPKDILDSKKVSAVVEQLMGNENIESIIEQLKLALTTGETPDNFITNEETSNNFVKSADMKDNTIKLLNEFNKEVGKVLETITPKINSVPVILDQLKDRLMEAIPEGKSSLKDGMNLKEKIKKELIDLININEVNKEPLTINEDIKMKSAEVNNKYNVSNSLEKTLLKEENLLKNLVSDDKDKKELPLTKVTSFASQFEPLRNIKVPVEADKIVINKNTFNQDIIKALKFMDTSSLKEMTVKIAPKELGEVFIRLTMDSGVMKATISATNKEAYNILNSNLSEISNKLAEQNMKIQTFDVSLSNENLMFSNQQNQGDSSRQGSKGKTTFSGFQEEDSIEEPIMEQGNINILA